MNTRDEIANREFGMDYDQLGRGEKEFVDDEMDPAMIEERKAKEERRKTEAYRLRKKPVCVAW